MKKYRLFLNNCRHVFLQYLVNIPKMLVKRPPPSLHTIPDIPLSVVLNHSSWDTVQALRKVCRRLRGKIDETRLDMNVEFILVERIPNEKKPDTYETKSISVSIGNSKEMRQIVYEESGNGCLVVHENTRKVLENESFAHIAANDIGIILKTTKSIIQKLILKFPTHPKYRYSLNGLETMHGRFLESMSHALLHCPTKLSAKLVEIFGTRREGEVMKLINVLNPSDLEELHIWNDEKDSCPTFHIQSILGSEQWKMAKRTSITGLYCNAKLEDFRHFERATFRLLQITHDELVLFKDWILENRKTEVRCTVSFLKFKRGGPLWLGRPTLFMPDLDAKWIFNYPMDNFQLVIYLAKRRKLLKIYSKTRIQ